MGSGKRRPPVELGPSPLLDALRSEMKVRGDAERAAAQQRYMKSSMPFWGLPSAEMRLVCRTVFRDYGSFSERAVWERDVLEIWRGAEKREERYAAIELLQHRRARVHHTIALLPTVEDMIVTGAWWDYVDSLASHDLGWMLERDPEPMRTQMLEFSQDENMWKRRSAIICQLHTKSVDYALLYACIEPSLAEKEFFLRKAIGWSLRQLAWRDPKEVLRYVQKNLERLSPLSIREALKNVEVPDSLKKRIAKKTAR